MMEKQILFTEVQKFRQWWFWLIIIVAATPLVSILIYQVVTGHSVGQRPLTNMELFLISVLVLVPMLSVFYFIKLFTVVDTESIYYGFGFSGKALNEIKLADVQQMEVMPYKFLSIGMHMSTKYGTVYNTSYGEGLFITLHSGKRVLIGTQQPEALKTAIERMVKRK